MGRELATHAVFYVRTCDLYLEAALVENVGKLLGRKLLSATFEPCGTLLICGAEIPTKP